METCLDFERHIFEVEKKINELKLVSKTGDVNFSEEIKTLEKKATRLKKDIFLKLTRWQRVQVARHPNRPYTLDYIEHMTTDFMELHGDRVYGDGTSIIGGFAKIDDLSVMIIGHQKGRDTKDKVYRNFGMSNPEGYRKALRLMKLAEKFGKPIVTLCDTPGAYPGVGAEQRGQSVAIAKNLTEMSSLKVPILVVVIGEGGSGGALALGIGDSILMLEHSVYSVISPEGCASILWGDAKKVSEASEALSLTADDMIKLKVIDEIVKEPIGGAHCNYGQMASILRRSIRRNLNLLLKYTEEELLLRRYDKFRKMGTFIEQGL